MMTAIERSSPSRRSRSAAGSWTLIIAPGGSVLEQPATERDEGERVLEAHHAGQAGRRVLPQAVTDHDARPDGERLEQARHGVLRGEQGGQRERGTLELRRLAGTEHERAQVHAE